ncbi:MAG: flavodoxin family protein [Acetivibrionales bacterium]|jgi:NAD(P)H-dependent FMN reductase
MKIVVINGTEVKGCTYHIKELFLEILRDGNEITEFYLPKDLPHFCRGCKVCFFKDENLCPHAAYTMPIWNAILEADLLVFATPVYVLRIPGQMKALLDHFSCHWMPHRPDKAMFRKRAVILTNSVGAPNGSAQKDIITSLTWMGISDIRRLGFGLMEGVIWNELSDQRRNKIKCKTVDLANKYVDFKEGRMGLKVKIIFSFCKRLHQGLLKKEESPSADNQHWINNGWIKI